MKHEIASTILRQLGGNQFLAMTGTYGLVAMENGMVAKLRRNQSKANHIKITLNGMDVYDVKFINVRGTTIKTVKEYENVYDDMLVSIFESETGMYTKL